MSKRNNTKRQMLIYKNYKKKLNIEQQECHKKSGMTSADPGG
jgi:hypothetical protein